MQRFELLFFFVWRDLLVRYKNAALGITWALIRPLLNMGLFVILFSKMEIRTHSYYPYFLLAGLIPWQFMASVLQSASVCLIQNAQLIQKASFPRIYLPMSCVIVNGVDALISLTLFLPFLNLPFQAIFFPLFFILLFFLGFSFSLWFSAVTVKVRDLIIAIPYLIQVGIFITPIAFPIDQFPEKLQPLFLLNPLVGIVDGFRWTLLGEWNVYASFSIPYSILFTLASLLLGVRFFKQVETHIADTL